MATDKQNIVDKIENNHITIDENKILTVMDKDNVLWFNARHVAVLLKYKKLNTSIKSNVEIRNRKYYSELNIDDDVNSQITKIKNFQKQSIFINEYGLKYLICITKSAHSSQIAKFFNINVCEYKALSKESDTLSKILKVFKNEKSKTQFSIGSYFIDLYFIDDKIAIECDEQ